MATADQTTVLGAEIEARLKEFTGKRLRDKRKAFALRIGAATLGALVTVLLGLKVGAGTEASLKNVALVAAALVAILNAWDAFYDHRTLWVKRTLTVGRLNKLKRAYAQATAAQPQLPDQTHKELIATLEQIVDDDLNNWVQMRSEPSNKGAAASGTGRG
jgi:hypothetical protein